MTYATDSGEEQRTVPTGWSQSVTLTGTAVLVAQARLGQTINCSITENGIPLASNSSTGDHAVVTCRG